MTAALIHCEQASPRAGTRSAVAAAGLRESDNPQIRAGYADVEARLLRAEGRPADALAAAERALPLAGELTITDTSIKTALVEAIGGGAHPSRSRQGGGAAGDPRVP